MTLFITHHQVNRTLEILDREQYRDYAVSFQFVDNSKDIFFMDRSFNHNFYDSLISSGRINFLRPKLQQQVQSIFRKIKNHNRYLDMVETLQDDDGDNEILQKTHKYYQWMDTTEIELERDIPIMLKKLEKDFYI